MKQVKIFILIAITSLITIFTLQNMGHVELTFGIWSVESRRIVVIGLSFAAGFIVAMLLNAIAAGRQAVKATTTKFDPH